MAIQKTVSYAGNKMTSTLSGNINLDEGSGELIIRNGVHVLTRINSEGFTYSEPNGTRRIRIGLNPKDGTIVDMLTKPGYDVVDEMMA